MHYKVSPLTRSLVSGARPSTHQQVELLRKHHCSTGEHVIRVAGLAVDIAIACGFLNLEELQGFVNAALRHDVNKREISVDLLNKKELTPAEKEIIRQHVKPGVPLPGCTPFEDKIAHYHHEHSNLDSYPRTGKDRRERQVPVRIERRRGERRQSIPEIKKAGEILAVCDMVDAVVNDRPYRSAIEVGEAFQLLIPQFKGDVNLLIMAWKRVEP